MSTYLIIVGVVVLAFIAWKLLSKKKEKEQWGEDKKGKSGEEHGKGKEK